VFVGVARSGSTSVLHCEFGELAPDALTHAAMQTAFCFALAELGDDDARRPMGS